MNGRCAATKAAWEFSRVEEFWSRFSPLSPLGKDEKEARSVYSDASAIARLHDETEAAIKFLALAMGDTSTQDRVGYHLKRLPRLGDYGADAGGKGAEAASLDLVELFEVKKFMANYRAISRLVDEGTRDFFSLGFMSEGLAGALELGGSDAETFFIADAYDEGLKAVRNRIARLDEESAGLRAAALAAAFQDCGLDFRGRDFLIVAHADAGRLLERRSSFAVEPYDDASYVVRLQPSDAELALAVKRDAATLEERRIEEVVLARLSAMVGGEAERLGAYEGAVTRFDLALARARLAIEYSLTRPEFRDALPNGDLPRLEVARARFLPCAWECERLSLRYSELDFGLAERTAVVFGSNMGGKTVALESLVFLQVLAQAGFFVPAERYSTSVYPLIHYVGERKGDLASSAGLSGFGFEIRSFVEAWEGSRGGAFLVFDEFARTTSSREAEAILSAVVEALRWKPGVRSVLSTHFREVSRIAGVRYLRVLGLDREAATDAMCGTGNSDGGAGDGNPGPAPEGLGERIRRINGMMRYGLVDDGADAGAGSDAVAIASLLGLDRGIVRRAEEIYAENTHMERI
jgi:hypothetical protein